MQVSNAGGKLVSAARTSALPGVASMICCSQSGVGVGAGVLGAIADYRLSRRTAEMRGW